MNPPASESIQILIDRGYWLVIARPEKWQVTARHYSYGPIQKESVNLEDCLNQIVKSIS